ncbi:MULTISPECIES: hypothetical protein [unclassified Arthrobacter]|nr:MULTISPECIES: hypothetical protein [unclassified Arthrobacter]
MPREPADGKDHSSVGGVRPVAPGRARADGGKGSACGARFMELDTDVL